MACRGQRWPLGGGGNQGLSLIEPGALRVCLIIHAFSRTIIGGLSPRRIRRGSDRVREPVRQSVRRGGLRRTHTDPKKVRRVRLSPPRIRSDPPSTGGRSARKRSAAVSTSKRRDLSPPTGGLSLPFDGLCPPRKKSAKRTRCTLSAADKVRQYFPAEKVRHGLFP